MNYYIHSDLLAEFGVESLFDLSQSAIMCVCARAHVNLIML